MFITYYFVLRFFLSIAYYMLFMVAVAATITNLNIIVFAIFNVAIVIVILRLLDPPSTYKNDVLPHGFSTCTFCLKYSRV